MIVRQKEVIICKTVVSGQWRRAEAFGPCVRDGGRASFMGLVVSPVPKSEGPGAP